jgi:hypothetical protein
MLHKDYNRKCSVENKYWSMSEGACRQDELIVGKPTLTMID